MANRIIRKVSKKQDPLQEKTSDQVILDFLLSNGRGTFGQIWAHLREQEISYTKKGYSLRLRSLLKRGILTKNRTFTDMYPVYRIARGALPEVILGGFDFRIRTESWFNEIPKSGNSKHKVENLIQELITRIGFYVLYVHLHSWKLTTSKYTVSENAEIRRKWLKSTLYEIEDLMPFRILLDLIPPELTNKPGLIYEDKEKIRRLFELEKILEKTHPKESNICKNAMSGISSKVSKPRISSTYK